MSAPFTRLDNPGEHARTLALPRYEPVDRNFPSSRLDICMKLDQAHRRELLGICTGECTCIRRKLEGSGSGMVHAGGVARQAARRVKREKSASKKLNTSTSLTSQLAAHHLTSTSVIPPLPPEHPVFSSPWLHRQVSQLGCDQVPRLSQSQSHHCSSSPQHRPQVLQHGITTIPSALRALAPLLHGSALQPRLHLPTYSPEDKPSTALRKSQACAILLAPAGAVHRISSLCQPSPVKASPQPSVLSPLAKISDARYAKLPPQGPTRLWPKPPKSPISPPIPKAEERAAEETTFQPVGLLRTAKRPYWVRVEGTAPLSFAAICSPVKIFTQSEGPPSLSHRLPTPTFLPTNSTSTLTLARSWCIPLDVLYTFSSVDIPPFPSIPENGRSTLAHTHCAILPGRGFHDGS
ncbi:hypothetical protein BDZ45DRAFT_754793 [Acephala macrosclerotiorum]|nr:hypothetical protein BDZ45DRAFT_754793 [Acephala macrosclerotiorum]